MLDTSARDRGKDQRVHHPAPRAVEIEQQAHAPEVDLELLARVAIRDAHGRSWRGRS